MLKTNFNELKTNFKVLKTILKVLKMIFKQFKMWCARGVKTILKPCAPRPPLTKLRIAAESCAAAWSAWGACI